MKDRGQTDCVNGEQNRTRPNSYWKNSTVTLTVTIYNVDFQSLAKAMAYTQAINEGQRPVSSKDRQETDGHDRLQYVAC